MNNKSKLMLSDEELQLVTSSEWILTKRIILDKVDILLGNLAVKQKAIIKKYKSILPIDVVASSAKISKGENYLQLPYRMLDYPRCFTGEHVFAVRTMFWWGNFFCVTILLSGNNKKVFENGYIAGNAKMENDGFFIGVNESPWHHHFEEDNYIALKNITKGEAEKIIQQKDFIKLAVRFPLQQWNDMPELLENAFIKLIGLLKP